jgi:predicted XRE-type DNA-binding protein
MTLNHLKPKDLITLSEAARLLGVSRPKMSRLVSGAKLTPFDDPLDERAKLVSRQEVLSLQVRDKAA